MSVERYRIKSHHKGTTWNGLTFKASKDLSGATITAKFFNCSNRAVLKTLSIGKGITIVSNSPTESVFTIDGFLVDFPAGEVAGVLLITQAESVKPYCFFDWQIKELK